MSALDGLLLAVPEFWTHGQEWQDAIDESEPPERDLVVVQSRLADILRELEDAEATPDRLSWLMLWSRVFQCCEGARGAYWRRSVYTARLVERTIFEAILHLDVILEPKSRPNTAIRSEGARTFTSHAVRGRLEGYTAWCLYGDLAYWSEFRNEKNLRAIYDPAPAREFIRLAGEQRAYWEEMLGEAEIVSDQEAEFDLRQAREVADQKIERLTAWLRHPRLESWHQKLEQLDRRPGPVSLFALFNERETSVRRRLRSMGTPFAYVGYSRDSKVIHGSTLEESARLGGGTVGPWINATNEELGPVLDRVSGWGKRAVFSLLLLRPSTLP